MPIGKVEGARGGGKVEDLQSGNLDPMRVAMIGKIKEAVENNKEKIIRRSRIGTTVGQAYYWFKLSVAREMRLAQRVNVSNPDKVVRG